MELSRTKQCKNCPWKKASNPRKIPRYSLKRHKRLGNTIKEDLDFSSLRIMACHESGITPEPCVGWLANQLGRGNNIALRLKMMNCPNAKDIETFGEQHEVFQDTIPSDTFSLLFPPLPASSQDNGV